MADFKLAQFSVEMDIDDAQRIATVIYKGCARNWFGDRTEVFRELADAIFGRIRATVQTDPLQAPLMFPHVASGRPRVRRVRPSTLFASEFARAFGFPDIPAFRVSRKHASAPPVPGVYFFLIDETVVYVGETANLYRRLRDGGHVAWRSGDRITWIETGPATCTRKQIEAFYIAVLAPERNQALKLGASDIPSA